MTPRQELVLAAVQTLHRWREFGEMKSDFGGGRKPFNAEDAIVAVLDGHFGPGSQGEKMRIYHQQTSTRAHVRLLNEIYSRGAHGPGKGKC